MSASIDSFFATTPEPSTHPALRRALHAFLATLPSGARVACVTSGGTTVPLEVHTVRFVDNFSSGARGAATVEHLLAEGYYVVFLHRVGSTLPFVRRVAWLLQQQQQQADSPAPASSATSLNSFAFLRALHIEPSVSSDSATSATRASLQLGSGSAELAQHAARVLDSVTDYQQRLAARLLPLEFTSIADYLYALRTLCTSMRDMPPSPADTDAAAAAAAADAGVAGFSSPAVAPAAAGDGARPASWQRRCMLVLAAAVSDYYIPSDAMSVHKLQSRSGPLELRMEQTPKLLHALRHPVAAAECGSPDQADAARAWFPHGFCVSFKLETDSSLLVRKSRAALRAYGVNVVCANQLHTRYQRLQLVQLPQRERRSTEGGVGADAATEPSSSAASASSSAPVDDSDGVETVVRDSAPTTTTQQQQQQQQQQQACPHEFDVEIERRLVERLVAHHDAWINQQ